MSFCRNDAVLEFIAIMSFREVVVQSFYKMLLLDLASFCLFLIDFVSFFLVTLAFAMAALFAAFLPLLLTARSRTVFLACLYAIQMLEVAFLRGAF